MTSPAPETRTVTRLRTGTKLALLLALLLLTAAAYYYFVPAVTRTSQGSAFACGSAASPPSEDFPKNVCGPLTDIYRDRALALLAGALLSALGGFLIFGTDRQQQVRRAPRESGDETTTDGGYADPEVADAQRASGERRDAEEGHPRPAATPGSEGESERTGRHGATAAPRRRRHWEDRDDEDQRD